MPALPHITPGLTGTAELAVAPDHTAPFVGSGRITVLATKQRRIAHGGVERAAQGGRCRLWHVRRRQQGGAERRTAREQRELKTSTGGCCVRLQV